MPKRISFLSEMEPNPGAQIPSISLVPAVTTSPWTSCAPLTLLINQKGDDNQLLPLTLPQAAAKKTTASPLPAPFSFLLSMIAL